MNHASLFSGIGGFDLAAEWVGWDNVFHCEINEFCQKILKYYWPNAKTYENITADFTIWRGKIDIITGGFPCQPFSVAGKRKGTEDNRNLWPQMYRSIREIKPRWVVAENVPGIFSWGNGLVFEQIITDLENEGYEVLTFDIPACGKNAPHKRSRMWIVANSEYNGFDAPEIRQSNYEGNDSYKTRKKTIKQFEGRLSQKNVPDTDGLRLWRKDNRERKSRFINEKSQENYWNNFPTQPPVCGGNDGLSFKLDGITFSKFRKESIKAYGNAIVPQIAYEIFKTINKIENYETINQ